MIMTGFKKGYSMKIISTLIVTVFLITNTGYGIDLSNKTHLRIPVGSQNTYSRVQRAIEEVQLPMVENIPKQNYFRRSIRPLILGTLLASLVIFSGDRTHTQISLTGNDKSYYDNLLEQGKFYEVHLDIKEIIDYPWAEDIVKKLAKEQERAGSAFQDLRFFQDKPWVYDILLQYENLKEMFFTAYHLKNIKDKNKFREIIEPRVISAPLEALYIDDIVFIDGQPSMYSINTTVLNILKESKNPVIKKLCDLCQWAEDKGYIPMDWIGAVLLIDKIVKDDLSFEEAFDITKNPALFFTNIIEIKKRPDHLGGYSIDKHLKSISLVVVAKVNRLHDSPDAIRFKSVEDYDSEMLYNLMVYGENEVYTSTFNGLFTRMLEKMAKEGLTAESLFEKAGYNKFRTMIKLCAGFNRLNEFLNTIDKQNQIELLERFVRIKSDVKDLLSQAVTIADAFGMIEDKSILKILQQTIREEYESARKEDNKEVKVIYGLLSGMFAEKAVFDINWFKEMSDRYKLPDIRKMPAKKLFDEGLNIQRYYTYDDADGKASYNSILEQYSGKNEWSIRDKGAYTVIESKSLAGRKIEIYINKPEFEDEGQSKIEEVLKGKKVHVEVHVGHSYHANKTIERINPQAGLIILRSCGGYNEVSEILNKDPEAHIISTKGTGTMYVNEPLLYLLNNEMLKGKDIIWQDFWSKAEKILGHNQNFVNYIAPHKNLGVLFLKAYKKLMEQEQAKDSKIGLLIQGTHDGRDLLDLTGNISENLQGFRNIRMFP